ncbi:MAG: hypothetical protein Q9213_000763 [Squamulea squamosa]
MNSPVNSSNEHAQFGSAASLFNPKISSPISQAPTTPSLTAQTIHLATSLPLNPTQNAIDTALATCTHELRHFDDEGALLRECCWGSTLLSRTRLLRNLPTTLLNLYWRTQKQLSVFRTFILLQEAGHLSSPQALEKPVSFWRIPNNVHNVMQMLCCFSEIAECDDPPPPPPQPPQDGMDDPPKIRDLIPVQDGFDAAMHWLAVMICRCCADMDEVNTVMGLIGDSSLLGTMDHTAVERINASRAKEVRKYNEHVEYVKNNNHRNPKKWLNRTARRRLAMGEPFEEVAPGMERCGVRIRGELEPFFERNEMESVAQVGSKQRIFGLVLGRGVGNGDGMEGKQGYVEMVRREVEGRCREVERAFGEFFGLSVVEDRMTA